MSRNHALGFREPYLDCCRDVLKQNEHHQGCGQFNERNFLRRESAAERRTQRDRYDEIERVHLTEGTCASHFQNGDDDQIAERANQQNASDGLPTTEEKCRIWHC